MSLHRLAFLAALVLTLAACASRAPEPPPVAAAPLPALRRVVLVHAASGEKADVVYHFNGTYDARALDKISRLLRDQHTGQIAPVDPELLDFVYDMLHRTGLPPSTEVHVTSGYRSPETNAKLVKTNRQAARESFHIRGQAIDFHVPSLPGGTLAEIAKTMQRGGVAFYPSSGHIHLDTGPVRTWKTR